MKECTCIRYSLSKSVKDELMCHKKTSHKSHINGIPWLGLTCIMIGVERRVGKKGKKGVIMQKNLLPIARAPFPFFLSLFFSLFPSVFCACHAKHVWTIGQDSLD